MRKIYLGLWVLFLLLHTSCIAQNEFIVADTAPAAAQIDPFTWDFGSIKAGTIVGHTFLLKNKTEKTLNIKDVNTSCGCTISKIKKHTLLPGESAPIEVKFNSKGYSGQVQQYIYVNTDNLDNPVIRYIIKVYVVK